jgi:beta-mannosidase
MATVPLDGSWTLEAVRGPIPDGIPATGIAATVPGCAHTDLLAAGLIEDPFDADNESAQQWIGRTVWRYRRDFDWQPEGHERVDLVALGLDTLATIELNGAVLARTANQHRTYRFDVRHLLAPGTNTITVTFDAPVDAAERLSDLSGGARPHVNHHPYNALRKTASNFGWDWGIDVATSGIWRPIGLESWSGVRIAAVRPLVDVIGEDGILTAVVELEHASTALPTDVRVDVTKDDATWTATGQVTETGRISLIVPEVQRWWPIGHGDQPLYDVHVTAAESQWSSRVGFRVVELDTSPDQHGTRFELRVNGELILVRGANWIPDHAFLTEMTRERYARRIDDAVEAHMNLLRVWGGGIYESDDFYQLCDEHGVLVWQDFLFACAAYAEEPWLAAEVEPEAREAVTRLSPHPSLVLWNGNNENLVGYADWGWRAVLDGRSWGNGYYRDLLPRIVAELDPTRPYTPGSPYSFDDYLHPNDDRHGTVHIWDVWNTKDYGAYREWRPRFAAEFGFQGPPAWTTLVGVVHDEPLDPDGLQMLVHQKAHQGNRKLELGMRGHLPEPAGIEDWHFATQLNQAHAVRLGIEHFRSLTPYNTGTVVWQLNDNWPVISWAAVDFAERRKPLWFALRAAYTPRLVTVQPRGDGLAVVLVNDDPGEFAGEIELRRISFDGSVHAEIELAVEVPARGAATIPIPAWVAQTDEAAGEVLVATADGFGRALWNFTDIVHQRLAPEPFEAEVTPTPDGCSIRVTAHEYVRDLTLLVDRAHACASVDTSLVSLLPGETVHLTVSGSDPLVAEDVLSPVALRHAGQLADYASHSLTPPLTAGE